MELKFLVTTRQRKAITRAISGHLERDPFGDAAGRYPVVSLYYDNAPRDVYWEQVQGVGSRRKLRVRVYGGATECPPVSFVEIKHKLDGRTVKRRAALDLPSALALCADRPTAAALEHLAHLSAAEGRVVEEARAMARSRGLAPTCVVRYDREAFHGRADAPDLRLTFDDHVVYRLHDLVPVADDQDFDATLLASGTHVLEVKVARSMPYWLSSLLAAEGCLLQSHSKYCQIIERHEHALHRPLPKAHGAGTRAPANPNYAPRLGAVWTR